MLTRIQLAELLYREGKNIVAVSVNNDGVQVHSEFKTKGSEDLMIPISLDHDALTAVTIIQELGVMVMYDTQWQATIFYGEDKSSYIEYADDDLYEAIYGAVTAYDDISLQK
jgi:hypothetical protein